MVGPSGTVTFLFTDIEGSTSLWDAHPGEMAVALARHDDIVSQAVGAHQGHVFSTGGDGVCAAFSRSLDAVEAALNIQRSVGAEAWPADVVLRVRIGIHTGEAQERDGNFFGPPVNEAARIMAAAPPGQIVLSSESAGLLDRRAVGVDLLALGSFRLKGISKAVPLFGVVADDLPWTREVAPVFAPVHTNMPRPISDFIGRTGELHEKTSELPTSRLVTLAGTGGVGKTRLAIELGWSVIDDFAQGVWFVELAPVTDGGAVLAAAATTMSIPTQPGMTLLASIVDWLRGRRILIVLDNCEHVLSATSELVDAIVTGCPTVTILATSREPLGIPGERVHRLGPLDPAFEGVELFCARALAADDSFSPDDQDLASVAAICRRLDGLPLAIELAAARTTSLSLHDLLEHLDDRLRLVRTSKRHGPDRHHALRATVEWSYDLLGESEQNLFDRLSVFAGGFDLSAARAVSLDPARPDVMVLDLLGSLVDKSMVIAERRESGVRYRLLETLRQYAEERLAEARDTAQVRDRHLTCFVDLSQQTQKLLASQQQPQADAVFEREWDNLRAAHVWAVSTARLADADALVAATGVHALCRVRHEHGAWARRTLELGTVDHHPNPTTYGWVAYWTYEDGEAERAIEVARRGVEVALGPEDPDTVLCWPSLVLACLAAGKPTEAKDAARRCVPPAETTQDRFAAAWCYAHLVVADFATEVAAVPVHLARFASLAEQIGAPSLLAFAAFFEGRMKLWLEQPADLDGALACYRRGIEWARSARDVAHENWNLLGVVFAEASRGSPELGDVFREAITRFYDTRDWVVTGVALIPLASWFETTGNAEAATVIYGHLVAHRAPYRDIDGRLQSLRAPREHPDGAHLVAQGAAMDREQLVAFALEQLTESGKR